MRFPDALLLLLLILTLLLLHLGRIPMYRRKRKRSRKFRCPPSTAPSSPTAHGFPSKKPEWIRRAVLRFHECHPEWSHRKLADVFNQRYRVEGFSVGRTWVRELCKKQAYEALHRRREWKHRVPEPRPCRHTWGFDATQVRDNQGLTHIVLGIVDHGSRLNIALRRVRRLNVWTLLGTLFLAFGEHGVPLALRLDNHPVHHARWFKRVMRAAGVRLSFTELASPWQNGRIERLFGTLKTALRGYPITDAHHLDLLLAPFRVWYNAVRPHQHLGGRTPLQAWQGIDPYRRPPKRALLFDGWNGRLRGWVLRH
jgi:transposase InsO family protein